MGSAQEACVLELAGVGLALSCTRCSKIPEAQIFQPFLTSCSPPWSTAPSFCPPQPITTDVGEQVASGCWDQDRCEQSHNVPLPVCVAG